MSVFQVDDNGELVRERGGFVRISGIPSIQQDVTVYLRLFRGEIPSRLDLGIRWPLLFRAGVTESAIAQEVGDEGVLTRPGVTAVDDVVVDINRGTRLATMQYRATVSQDDLDRRLLESREVTITV